MAKYKKVYEIVIEKAVEILKQYPDGVDYGALIEKIADELPDILRNSIHGTFSTYFKYFPKQVVKQRRGFYIWIDFDKYKQTNKQAKKQNEKIENDLSVINGKILYIKLKNFQQFKDIELDFTYPKEHPRAGQPLNKICFLGQSGTGKTTLLNLIRYFSLSSPSKYSYPILTIDNQAEIEIKYIIPNFASVILIYKKGELDCKIIDKQSDISNESFNLNLYEYFRQIVYKLIYFPSDVIKVLDDKNKKDAGKFESIMEDKILDFDLLSPSYIWGIILNEIIEYNKNIANKSLEYTKNIISNLSNREEADRELNSWFQENPNPIKGLAENCLDSFLKKFGVQVKTEISKIESLDFVTLQTNDGKELETEQWSTGTKQIVIRGMSLFLLKPQNSIILFDEPENSMYPDVQNQVVDFYSSMAKESQMFFASHSPIIASSFEPFEIIELKYDELQTSIYQEKYYNGERSIDNYFLNPQYLTWGDILKYIFDVKEDSKPKRSEMLMDLAIMDEEIERLVSQGKKTEAQFMLKDYEKKAGLLKWNLNK